MKKSLNWKPSQSAILLIGILLTLVALAAHRFLPERRFTLDPAKKGVNFYLTKGEEGLTQVDWVDQSRVHFKCHFAVEASGANCGYTYLLARTVEADRGVDLSD